MSESPSVGVYNPNFNCISPKSPAFKFSRSLKLTAQECMVTEPQEVPYFTGNENKKNVKKKDSMSFERDFAKIMRKIKGFLLLNAKLQ